MENHELYKSAMDKITPSDRWQQDTLQKLAQARAQMAAGAENPTPKKKTIPFAKRAVPVVAAAAVLAVLVVPAALRLPSTDKGLASAAAFDSEAAPEALESMNEAAAAAEGSAPKAPVTLFRNAAAFPLKAGEQVSLRPQDADPCPESAEEPGPVRCTLDGALPTVLWYRDTAQRPNHPISVVHSLDDLKTQNPTWNLPAEQLPQTLPVWQAHAGPENGKLLSARMEKAAELLGLVYLPEPEKERPKDHPSADLWPDLASGHLMDPKLYDPELPLSEQPEGAAVWNIMAQQNRLSISRDGSSPAPEQNPDFEREAVRRSLEKFGSLLGTDTLSYSPGAVNFWYSPGLAEESIGEKLLNYSFKRLELLHPAENGEWERCEISAMPSSPLLGHYPLRSLEDAKAALEKEMAQAPLGAPYQTVPEDTAKKLSAKDVIAWEIEYQEGYLSPTILPFYHFMVKVPVDPKTVSASLDEPAADSDIATASYYICALPEELSQRIQYDFD